MGIPLYDELKSLCVAVYRGGERHLALLHCRATSRFDLEAARLLLRADRPLARVSAEELQRRFRTAYGTVTPFAEVTEFIQVFDTGLLARLTAPFTMITNAGDHTWGVEFYPGAVVETMRTETEVHVADITIERQEPAKLPAFGILTGNGPESGQDLWERLNNFIHRELTRQGRMYGDLSYPTVCVLSVPEMGLSMELDDRWDEVARVVDRGVDQLCAAGSDVLAIACNTTQVFAERIRERCAQRHVELLTMADVVAQYVEGHPEMAFTLVGIPVVASLGEHSAYRSLRELGVHAVAERARPHLQELGYLVKRMKLGEKNSAALNKLRQAVQSGVSTSHAIIALTEISVLLRRFPKLAEEIAGRTLIDPLQLYAEALAKRYIRELPAAADDVDDVWGEGAEQQGEAGTRSARPTGVVPASPEGKSGL